MMRREPVLITTVVCCVAVATGAKAETITWTGAGGNNSWHTAANWDLVRVPGDADDVVIPDMTPDVNVTYSSAASTSINSLTSAEAFTLSGGPLTLDAASTLDGDFALIGGTLTGTGDITVNAAMNWTGSAAMTGTGRTIITAIGRLSVSDLNNKTLGRRLENHSANAIVTDAQLTFNNGTLSNASDGTLTINQSSSFSYFQSGGTNLISNAGTLHKSGAGILTFNPGITFDNNGTFRLDAGSLNVAGGGRNSGVFDAEAGTTLTFSASYTHEATSTLGGNGTLSFAAGTHDISGSLTTDRTINVSTNAVNFNSAYDFSGVLNLNAGVLGGTGEVTVSGTMNWTGSAAMTGTGRTIITAIGRLSVSDLNSKTLGRRLENHSANFGVSHSQFTFLNGTLRNEADGTININQTAQFSYFSSGGINAITNLGTLNKSGVGILTINVGIAFDNLGTVNLDSGGLTLAGGGGNSGVFDVDAGTTLAFATSYAHGPTASLLGTGTLSFNGGTHDISGALTTNRTINVSANAVNFNSAYDFSSVLNLNAGVLGGTGEVTVSGTMNWTGGTAMTGTGRTIITAIGSLSVSDLNSKTLGRRLENHSANAIVTDAQFTFNNGTLSNASDGTLTINQSSNFSYFQSGGTNLISNAGTLNKIGGGHLTLNEGITFTNPGMLHIQAGTLSLAGGLTNASGTTLTDGTYIVTGTLRFAGANVVTNAATIILDGPASAIQNTVGGNGMADFAMNAANGTFQIKNGRTFALAGAFSNAGQVTIGPGDSTFSAASISNSGTITKPPGGSGSINADVTQTNSGIIDVQGEALALSTLTNFSGTTLTGGTYRTAGTLRFGNANIVEIAANVVLDGISSAIEDTLGTKALINLAAVTPTGALRIENDRSLALAGDFNNAGQVTIGPGDCLLALPGSYVQSAGMTRLDGGTIDPADLVDIQGGDLEGNGEVLGNVTNAGTCKPGLSPGSLSITGDYTQTTAGTLVAEIGGTIAGTEYDTLSVGGEATLLGTLRVLLINDFEPAIGETFDIVTGGSISPKFATIDLPTLPNLLGLQLEALPADLLLNVIDCGPGDADGDGVGDACDTLPDLSWHTIDGGGATFSSGGGFRIGATIGQPDAGVLTGGVFELVGGFWADAPTPAPSPGDMDGDGRIDLEDFDILSGCLGGPDFELGIDCSNADLNGDGNVDLLDFAEFQIRFAPE